MRFTDNCYLGFLRLYYSQAGPAKYLIECADFNKRVQMHIEERYFVSKYTCGNLYHYAYNKLALKINTTILIKSTPDYNNQIKNILELFSEFDIDCCFDFIMETPDDVIEINHKLVYNA